MDHALSPRVTHATAQRPHRLDLSTHADEDPTGYKTLQAVLGHPDMGEFQTSWEAWIMTLRYP